METQALEPFANCGLRHLKQLGDLTLAQALLIQGDNLLVSIHITDLPSDNFRVCQLVGLIAAVPPLITRSGRKIYIPALEHILMEKCYGHAVL